MRWRNGFWCKILRRNLKEIWNHDISLPALQHIMTHEKSFVTFYMDTHFQNHCMIFTMHDSLQVASDSVSSPHRFFNSLILCAAFCFSSFLIWALIAFNSRESFFLPLLFTGAGKLGLVTGTSLLFGSSLWVMIIDKSILNWCRCNLVVSWVWNRILQRDFKIFIRIRVNGLSKEFVKVHRISHLWINRIRTSQSLDPFCNGDGNEHL